MPTIKPARLKAEAFQDAMRCHPDIVYRGKPGQDHNLFSQVCPNIICTRPEPSKQASEITSQDTKAVPGGGQAVTTSRDTFTLRNDDEAWLIRACTQCQYVRPITACTLADYPIQEKGDLAKKSGADSPNGAVVQSMGVADDGKGRTALPSAVMGKGKPKQVTDGPSAGTTVVAGRNAKTNSSALVSLSPDAPQRDTKAAKLKRNPKRKKDTPETHADDGAALDELEHSDDPDTPPAQRRKGSENRTTTSREQDRGAKKTSQAQQPVQPEQHQEDSTVATIPINAVTSEPEQTPSTAVSTLDPVAEKQGEGQESMSASDQTSDPAEKKQAAGDNQDAGTDDDTKRSDTEDAGAEVSSEIETTTAASSGKGPTEFEMKTSVIATQILVPVTADATDSARTASGSPAPFDTGLRLPSAPSTEAPSTDKQANQAAEVRSGVESSSDPAVVLTATSAQAATSTNQSASNNQADDFMQGVGAQWESKIQAMQDVGAMWASQIKGIQGFRDQMQLSMSEQLRSRDAEVAALRKERETLQMLLKGGHETAESLEQAIEAQTIENRTLKDTVTAHERTIAAITVELEALQAQCTLHEAEIKKTREYVEVLKDGEQSLTRAMGHLTRQLDESRRKQQDGIPGKNVQEGE